MDEDIIFHQKNRPYPLLPRSGFAGCTKVCFNCRTMMLLERERTSPDEWRWYVTITSNKLFTRK